MKRIKKLEYYKGLRIEYSKNKSGYGVWTQIYDQGTLISSYDSDNKTQAQQKAKHWINHHYMSDDVMNAYYN